MLFHRGKARPGGALMWSLAAVGLVALWGGLWWWVKYGSESEEFDVSRPRRFKVKPSEMGQGIYVHTKGVIRIVAGEIEIHLRPRPDGVLEMYAFAMNTGTWLTPEQDELRKVGRKVSAGGKFVETLGVSTEQVNQARELRFSTDVVLTGADQARLAEPFRKWQETRGDEHDQAEKALLATAKEVGEGVIATARQALINDIEQVPALLTREQWQKYLDLNLKR